MSWFTRCRQKISSCCAKCWDCVSDWRKTDALLRGLARGGSVQTFINFIGKLSGRNLHTAASISMAPTIVITTYTSYRLTRPQDRRAEYSRPTVDTMSEESPLLEHSQSPPKMTLFLDALARGISRADATIAAIDVLSLATKYDLETLAAISGLAALILGTWSSYQMATRSANRVMNNDSPTFFGENNRASVTPINAPTSTSMDLNR